MNWLMLLFRWLHIITGVAWIGASFYFNWLEGRLNRDVSKLGDEFAGDLWAVHGGGFYHVLKYRVAPAKLPESLHWFKWEAYFTWITGMVLLILLYYFGAQSYLIDKQVYDIQPGPAIAIGLGSVFVAWFIYDALCRSPLIKKPYLFSSLLSALLIGLAWGYTQIFAPRAAYIHVGAAIGTIMAANVFRVIIPSQKVLVANAEKGLPGDEALGKAAGLRSLHNNYLTLPLLFIMISNHYPMTYGHKQPWLILAAITVIGALARHFFNLRNKGRENHLLLPIAALGMMALAFVTRPSTTVTAAVAAPSVSFEEVHAVVQKRCVPCHSSNPTDDVFKIAPNGVFFDTAEQIHARKDLMIQRAAYTKDMPLANKTGMTDEERQIFARWAAGETH